MLETNVELISFGNLIFEIQMGSFHRDLPNRVIKTVTDRKEEHQQSENYSEGQNKQKQSQQIINNDRV